jgi:hypothetical protein
LRAIENDDDAYGSFEMLDEEERGGGANIKDDSSDDDSDDSDSDSDDDSDDSESNDNDDNDNDDDSSETMRLAELQAKKIAQKEAFDARYDESKASDNKGDVAIEDFDDNDDNNNNDDDDDDDDGAKQYSKTWYQEQKEMLAKRAADNKAAFADVSETRRIQLAGVSAVQTDLIFFFWCNVVLIQFFLCC